MVCILLLHLNGNIIALPGTQGSIFLCLFQGRWGSCPRSHSEEVAGPGVCIQNPTLLATSSVTQSRGSPTPTQHLVLYACSVLYRGPHSMQWFCERDIRFLFTWDSEKVSDLPKATQLKRARVHIQNCLVPRSMFLLIFSFRPFARDRSWCYFSSLETISYHVISLL